MVLSAALDSGYVFITLVAILTSVISAVYYLAVIKQIFFENNEYMLNLALKDLEFSGIIKNIYKKHKENRITFTAHNIVLSNYLTITVSSLTLLLVMFVFTPQETLSMANLLALILFNC